MKREGELIKVHRPLIARRGHRRLVKLARTIHEAREKYLKVRERSPRRLVPDAARKGGDTVGRWLG